MEELIFAWSEGSYACREVGKIEHSPLQLLLKGILIAPNEDPDFLPDLVLNHCFLEDTL